MPHKKWSYMVLSRERERERERKKERRKEGKKERKKEGRKERKKERKKEREREKERRAAISIASYRLYVIQRKMAELTQSSQLMHQELLSRLAVL